jgi:hypothetical protein
MGWDHSTITYDTSAVSFLKIVKPEIRNPKLEIRNNFKIQIPNQNIKPRMFCFGD